MYGYNILRTNSLLKHVTEGKMEGKGKRGLRCTQLLDAVKETKIYWKFERRSGRSHCLENSLWKRLWPCRKADCLKVVILLVRLNGQSM